MNSSGFAFLDYVWRILLIGTSTATVVLGILLVAYLADRLRMGQRQMKWYFNVHFAVLLVTVLGEGLIVVLGDSELANHCFARFVDQSAIFSLTRFVAGAWLSAVVLILLGDSLRVLASSMNLRRAERATEPEIVDQVEECRRRMKVEGPVEVRSSSKIRSPFVLGRRIFLPRRLGAGLRHILMHEMAHVRDCDAFWIAAELLCRRLLFFHPLMMFLGREYRVIVERAADEAAMEAGGIPPADYVRTLLRVSEESGLQLPPLQVGISQGYREIRSRIEAAVARRSRRSRLSYLLLTVLSLGGGLGLSLAQAEVQTKAEVGVGVCRQVTHELLIGSWLRIPRESIRCERK